ncbi:MAG: RDD family protein [Cyanobacteria bacterium J06642_2]
MTNSRPPYRPERSPQPQRRDYREFEEKVAERRTFDALPAPPAPRVEAPYARPAAESETATDSDLASLKRRAGAFALDFGVGLGAAYVAQGLASLFGAGADAVSTVGYVSFFAAWLANRGYLQSRPSGQSIGKWLVNIKTIDAETDESPTLLRSMAREGVSSFLILTESLLVPLGADALFAAFDKEKRQSLHDRAARTKVVNAEEGYQLDEKIQQWLDEGEAGEVVDELRSAAKDIWQQAKQNENIGDLGSATRDVQKNVNTLGRQAGKQAREWVENMKDKLDNI